MNEKKQIHKNIDIRIMAYLDGELDKQEARQIEELIEKDSRYRQTYEAMKNVQEATRHMKFKNLPEFYWDEYWQHVYNRIERGFSWIFISIGTIIVLGFLVWNMLDRLFESQNIHPVMKGGIILLLLGILILIVSVIREKLMVRKVDKYSEVER